ncbi:hypothetical protein V5074_15795 [Atlantibacter hermannii]|uniref:hypothetical protein n=1 Tax=Atlantibacter hermannii TaxID=565 RepID=UPI00307650EC
MKKDSVEFQELLDIISDLRREVNVLNTAFCYLPFTLRGEQMRAVIESLRYESINETYDDEQRAAFKRIVDELDKRTKDNGEFRSISSQ